MTRLTLSRKVFHDNKEFETLDIDEPTVGGIEAFERAKAKGETDTTATIEMLAVDTGWPVEAIRKIRASDLVKISDAIAPFVDALTPVGGPTGA
ncbi:MAG: phage tail assembly protein [Xanthobacteraceae bacterium]